MNDPEVSATPDDDNPEQIVVPPSSSGLKQDGFETWIHPPLRNCYFLTGATGSGKTPLAIELAKQLDAEIISLDSMAIYRGMDIGTAKPDRQQRASVPHHMLDICEPTESYSVSSYVVRAHEVAEEIRSRGKRVLVCGGTPLYLKSLIRGLFLGPEADWEFRNAIEAEIEKHGEAALRQRLEQVDPLLSHKLHPNDHRRIIRALEVAKHTGRPLSHWQEQFETPARREEFPIAVISIDRAWLHERINARVDQMLGDGLQAEVEGLLSKHGELGRTAAQAVGYREILAHLNEGVSMDETVESIKAHTRQFARRQEIWFRGLQELQPIDVRPDKPIEELVVEALNIFDMKS